MTGAVRPSPELIILSPVMPPQAGDITALSWRLYGVGRVITDEKPGGRGGELMHTSPPDPLSKQLHY
jgi:hypothetical protein